MCKCDGTSTDQGLMSERDIKNVCVGMFKHVFVFVQFVYYSS